MYGDADLDYMVGHDFGVAVVYGTQKATWQLDVKWQEVLAGHVSGISASDLSIFGRAGSLTGLAIGAAITVDGVAYVIRDVQPEDASTTRVELKKA